MKKCLMNSTTTQKAKIRTVFANNMSTDIQLSMAQLSKIIQFAGPLMKDGLHLAFF